MLAQGIAAIRQSGPHQGVILLEHGKTNGGSGPATAAEIKHPVSIGGAGVHNYLTLSAIVPDGVATVELDHRAIGASSRSTASAHPFSITARVINDVLVARVPRNAFPLKIIWRRADGSVSETF